MEKMLKFLDDFGAVGGVGAFLLLSSWGLLVTDLVEFKLANIAGLSTTRLIATLAGTLGLLLLLYRLKQATKDAAKRAVTKELDNTNWEKFASFIKDRRALVALQDYEHLPSMLTSIDAIRAYIRDELDSLPIGSLDRPDFEAVQQACREFASACDDIWKDRQAMPAHLVEALPYEQWRFCTAVGVLRGQVATMLQAHSVSNAKSLIDRLVGRR